MIALVVFGLILFRSTTQHWFPHLVRQWDLLLPFVIYFGQRRGLIEGLILSLFTSHLYSLSSVAPVGVFATVYLVLFVIARLLSTIIYANRLMSIAVLIGALFVLERMVLTGVAFFFGHGWPLFSMDNFVWWSIFFNASVGSIFYLATSGVDRLTFKVPPINIELAETQA